MYYPCIISTSRERIKQLRISIQTEFIVQHSIFQRNNNAPSYRFSAESFIIVVIYTHTFPRLGNLVTGFMISDESGNRFFPTAVTDYWQDRAGITYQQTYFLEFFPNLRTFSYLELSIKSDSAIRASMSSQKLHNMSIWLRLVSISSIRQLFHKQVHGSCLL